MRSFSPRYRSQGRSLLRMLPKSTTNVKRKYDLGQLEVNIGRRVDWRYARTHIDTHAHIQAIVRVRECALMRIRVRLCAYGYRNGVSSNLFDTQKRTVPSRACSVLPEDVASTVSLQNGSGDGNYSFDLTFREVRFRYVSRCNHWRRQSIFVGFRHRKLHFGIVFQGRRAIRITICAVAANEGAQKMTEALIQWPLMNKAMKQVRLWVWRIWRW